jgi:hypothetical protein
LIVVRIPEEFIDELLGHARAISGPFVFLPNQNLHNTFDRILKRSGFAKVNALGRKLTAHSFRHTFATRMAQQIGNNPFIRKELMGHSKITTTKIFCHPVGRSKKRPLARPFKPCGVNGGPEEARTPDLRVANAALSQLSYRPTLNQPYIDYYG